MALSADARLFHCGSIFTCGVRWRDSRSAHFWLPREQGKSTRKFVGCRHRRPPLRGGGASRPARPSLGLSAESARTDAEEDGVEHGDEASRTHA